VALNLVLKPLIDELSLSYFSELALRERDHLPGQTFYSLNKDCRWHRDWSQALTRMVVEDPSHNIAVIEGLKGGSTSGILLQCALWRRWFPLLG
jgi:Methane/Phenol/Toluene Hydroxylase